jgi:hypothetical protein
MSKLTLINAMPHFTPLKCPLCGERFKIGNGPWPAQPIEGDKRGAVKPVCIECASTEEPDRDYGADWQIILDNIAMGTWWAYYTCRTRRGVI